MSKISSRIIIDFVFVSPLRHSISKGLRRGTVFYILLIVLLFSHSSSAHPMKPLKIQKSDGSQLSLRVEIADNDEERMKGLMFRKTMGINEGMLFVFDQDTANPFWMKNTPLPLDILFISSDQRIVAISEKTVPFSEKLIEFGTYYRFALELNAGFVAKHKIKKGDKIIYER